jgi:hypothetical protein
VKSGKCVLAIVLCTVLLATGRLPVAAQQATGHYFPQTGHNVTGEFWTFYQGVPDAAIVFGMPLTEQFATADGSGLLVQYFEKARLELHPDQPIGRRVVQTPIGVKLYQPGARSINLTTPGACRVFNGYGVCYDFLAFFDQHGGLDRFGSPISAFEFQPDGRLVQYFERARFEWHPEFAPGQNVLLADLGRIYFNGYEDPGWLNAALPLDNIPLLSVLPLSLRARAFVARAVTLPDDTQEIYVVVQDQALAPVSGATGRVTVHLPTGQDLSYPVTTDANGLGVVASVAYAGQLVGSLVTVSVQMSYQGLSAETTTSFRIWH